MFTVDKGATRSIMSLHEGLRGSYSIHVRDFEALEKCEYVMCSVEIVIH